VEIAEMLNTHLRTVQRWRNEGLPVLDDGVKPFLVMGRDLQRFLKDLTVRRRKPLGTSEFFCPRCQQPRKSAIDNIRLEFTQRNLGADHRQVIIRADLRDLWLPAFVILDGEEGLRMAQNSPSLSEPPLGLNP
jgi:hypothetical protein